MQQKNVAIQMKDSYCMFEIERTMTSLEEEKEMLVEANAEMKFLPEVNDVELMTKTMSS